MRALRYFVGEALSSLRRGYLTAVVAVATIAAALFVLGGFLVASANMERMIARWQDAAELSIYLRDDVTADQRNAIERVLRDSHLARDTQLVSKQEALQRFSRNFGGLEAAAAALPENPLPASIEVRLPAASGAADVDALADRAAKMSGVADVRYDRLWLERLRNIARLVRAGGFVLAVVLAFAAALTVASVVRLALLARREEIHIMQLVGAPLAYIRGPFVVEGLIEGGVGATVALGLLWALFTTVRANQLSSIIAIDPSSLTFLSVRICAALLAGGMAVGCLGGLMAARHARERAD
jgi:cell division transport system permease protein